MSSLLFIAWIFPMPGTSEWQPLFRQALTSVFERPDVADWALSTSKALQVLLPLGIFILIRELPWRESLLRRLAALRHPGAGTEAREELYGTYERRLGRALGFLSWKIGCDLGFFILMGPSLSQAFTLAGLIPYTIGQYVIYRLFGQKMLLSGMMNPFGVERYTTPSLQRKKPVRRFLAKFFHEDMNSTSMHTPVRRVILKPLADYLAVVVCWSLYSMGIFFVQSGEINWHPFSEFPHAFMIGMYFGGVISFILGYNAGEYLALHLRLRILAQIRRANDAGRHLTYWQRSMIWRFLPFSNSYGVRLPGIVSILCGIAMVPFLAPAFLNLSLTTACAIQSAVFVHTGTIPPRQLAQIAPPPTSAAMPDFQTQWRFYQSLEAGGK